MNTPTFSRKIVNFIFDQGQDSIIAYVLAQIERMHINNLPSDGNYLIYPIQDACQQAVRQNLFSLRDINAVDLLVHCDTFMRMFEKRSNDTRKFRVILPMQVFTTAKKRLKTGIDITVADIDAKKLAALAGISVNQLPLASHYEAFYRQAAKTLLSDRNNSMSMMEYCQQYYRVEVTTHEELDVNSMEFADLAGRLKNRPAPNQDTMPDGNVLDPIDLISDEDLDAQVNI
jgi:hypothetical protein